MSQPITPQEAVERAMREHPTGLIVAPTTKTISVIYWTDKECPIAVNCLNTATGFIQQAIDTGQWTKEEILSNLQKTLKQREPRVRP